MFRLMSYCQQLFLLQKVVPVVLVFAISQIKPEITVNCKTSRHHAFLLKYRKETWAESCYFADYKSIESSLQDIPLHPLVGLSFFLTGKFRSLAANPLNTDRTIQKLYSIAEDIFKNHIITKHDHLDDFLDVCQRANNQIEQGLTYLRGNTLDNNTRSQVELSLMGASSILSAFQQKPLPTSSETSPLSSPSPSPSALPSLLPSELNQELQLQSSTKGDQWTFAKNYIDTHKSNNSRVPIPWEAIYRDGRAKGYFSTFTSASSMRTNFYRQKKIV